MVSKYANKIQNNIALNTLNAVCIFLIIVFPLTKLNSIYLPWVYDDEIGYWGQAAYLIGKNWNGILQHSEYYSFGYGLLLAPLMIIIKEPVLLYRVAIGLNVLFIICSYFLAKKIARKICNLKEYQICLVALVSVLTGNVSVAMTNTLVESLLIFLYWLLIYLFVGNIQKTTTLNTILGTCVIIYMYMVHMRTIGILVVYIVFLIFFSIRERNIKLLLPILLILAGILITAIYKAHVQEIIWKKDLIENVTVVNVHEDVNGFKSQIFRALDLITSKDGLSKFFRSFVGKFYYFLISSFFTIILVAKKIILNSKNFFSNRIQGKDCIYFFIFLNFIVEMMITVVSTAGAMEERSDFILYGRYAENVFGPIFMLGIIELWDIKKSLSYKFGLVLIGISSFALLLCEVINVIFSKKGVYYFTFSIVNFSGFISGDKIDFIKFAKFIALLLVVFFIYLLINKNRRIQVFSYYWLAIFGVLISFYNSEVEYNKDVLLWQMQKKEVIEASEYLEEYIVNREHEKIFYLMEDIHNKDGNRTTIQFLFPDREIQCLDYEEYSDATLIPNGILICTPENTEKEKLLATMNLIYENEEIVIIKN